MTTAAPDPDPEPPAIRPAIRADLLAVYRIEKASFPQPWPFSAFEGHLGDPGFLVADTRGPDAPAGAGDGISGGVAGYVVAEAVPNHGRPLGHVKDLAVHPDHRGRGIGSRLLDSGLRTLAGEGVDSVKLEVRESNDAARSLYREFGFVHRRTVPRYYGNGEDALVMVADLDAVGGNASGTDR